MFPVEPHIFCYSCFIHDIHPQFSKLDLKSIKYVFLGYSRLQKGYNYYSSLLNGYLVSTDVTFFEHLPFFPAISPPV